MHTSTLSIKSLLHPLQYWIPPVVCAVLIFWFSSQSTLPGFQLSIFDFFFKKIAHICAYASLYFFTRRAIIKSHPNLEFSDWRVWLLPMIICLIYAMSDELHQAFIPNRTATYRDIGYDYLGMLAVFLKQNKYI